MEKESKNLSDKKETTKIWENFDNYLSKNNLSILEFCKINNLNLQSFYQAHCGNTQNLRFSLVLKICKAFKISVQELYGEPTQQYDSFIREKPEDFCNDDDEITKLKKLLSSLSKNQQKSILYVILSYFDINKSELNYVKRFENLSEKIKEKKS